MEIINYGTIELNKALTAEAIEAVKKEFEPHTEWYEDYLENFEEGRKDILLEEYYDKEMEGTLKSTVNALKPLGYVLNAGIEYYGDYDGMTYIKDNEVFDLGASERWREDAEDSELTEVLRERGYRVAKDIPDVFGTFNNESSRVPADMMSDAKEVFEDKDNFSFLDKVKEEMETDDENDTGKLLDVYEMADNRDKSIIDYTLVCLTGYTLRSLLAHTGIGEA